MDIDKVIDVKLKPGTKYFTVPEIIAEASRIFKFTVPKSPDNGKFYDRIEQQIRRKLRGKKSYGEGRRNRKYTRNDVHHLLQIDLYDYFVKTSQKYNFKRIDKTKSNLPIMAKRQENLDDVVASKKASDALVPEYREQIKRWMDDSTSYLIREQDKELTEEDVEMSMKILVEKKKREIFFEFLYQTFFDSLIVFYEERLREDFNHQLDGFDFPDTPIQVMATNRLKDNRNYYESKLTLEEINKLLKEKIKKLLKELEEEQTPE